MLSEVFIEHSCTLWAPCVRILQKLSEVLVGGLTDVTAQMFQQT